MELHNDKKSRIWGSCHQNFNGLINPKLKHNVNQKQSFDIGIEISREKNKKKKKKEAFNVSLSSILLFITELLFRSYFEIVSCYFNFILTFDLISIINYCPCLRLVHSYCHRRA